MAGAAMIAAAVAATPASAMDVATFLAKVKALRAQGAGAATSPDLPLIKGELKVAAVLYRSRVEADRKAGRKPASCPPPPGEGKAPIDDLMVAFEAIPPAARTISVADAFATFARREYPCR